MIGAKLVKFIAENKLEDVEIVNNNPGFLLWKIKINERTELIYCCKLSESDGYSFTINLKIAIHDDKGEFISYTAQEVNSQEAFKVRKIK